MTVSATDLNLQSCTIGHSTRVFYKSHCDLETKAAIKEATHITESLITTSLRGDSPYEDSPYEDSPYEDSPYEDSLCTAAQWVPRG